MIWNAIQYVTTPLTLIAFVVAAIAFIYRSKLKQQIKILELVPDEHRFAAVNKGQPGYSPKLDNLTREQKHTLLLLENRLRHLKIIAYTAISLTILLIAMTALLIVAPGIIARTPERNPLTIEARDNFVLTFDPHGSVQFTGNQVKIAASIKDKENNKDLTDTFSFTWYLSEEDLKYLDISGQGNTVEITRKPEANFEFGDDDKVVITLGVSAIRQANNADQLSSQINLMVTRPLASMKPNHQFLARFADLQTMLPVFAPLTTQGDDVQIAFQFASLKKPERRPVVYLMDNRIRVYDPKRLKNEETNAIDIRNLIKDLPIMTFVETVTPGWEGGQAIVNADPALIIIHYHCFSFEKQDRDFNWETALLAFIKYVAGPRKRVQFLVYSRDENIIDKESIRLRFEQKTGVKGLRKRIHPLYMKETTDLFCDPASCQNLKDAVKSILSLPN